MSQLRDDRQADLFRPPLEKIISWPRGDAAKLRSRCG
jgi:hypothetical protein